MLLGEVIHGDYNTWVGPTKGLLHSGTNYQVKHWSNTGQYNIYIYIYIYNILVGRAHQGPAALGHQLPGQIPVEYWSNTGQKFVDSGANRPCGRRVPQRAGAG